MILLDSNTFIYLAKGMLRRDVIARFDIGYASITKIETLGFPAILANEQLLLQSLFKEAYSFALSDLLIDRAIHLRQLKKMSLGDAIIAATALEYSLPLWTANTEDFRHVDNLKVIDPLTIRP